MHTMQAKGWNSIEHAKVYFHNSEIQRQYAWEFLSSYPFKGHESVLDFGCRDGKMTAEISHFLKKGKIIGVDHSAAMIQLANLYFPKVGFANLEYRQLPLPGFGLLPSLLLKNQLEIESFDRILSLYLLHFISDQTEFLRQLYPLLKKNGLLMLIIPTQGHPSIVRASHETRQKFHLPASTSSSTPRDLEWARKVTTEAGFEITSIKLNEKFCFFADSEEMIQWMIGTYGANMGLPFEIMNPFFTEMYRRWIELDPAAVDDQGRIRLYYNRIEIVATK